MKMTGRLAAAGLAALLCGAPQASMIGKTLNMQWYAPDMNTPLDTPFNGNFVVTDGVEFNFVDPKSDGVLSIDVRDDRFVVTVGGTTLPDEGFFGFAIRDTSDQLAPIAGLHWVTAKPTDKEAPWLDFDIDTMWFNFAAIPGLPTRRSEPGWRRTFESQVRFGTAQPVPEPATYALMLLGLAAVATSARRRKAG